jgi:hypothetical protein
MYLPTINLFGLEIDTIIPFILLGAVIGWLLFTRFSKLSFGRATSYTIVGLLVGILAGRFFEYLIFLGSYLGNGEIIRHWDYLGAVFWPALAMGLGAIYLLARKRGDVPWSLVAAALRSLPFLMAVVWLGALISGTAWGMPSDLPWALSGEQFSLIPKLIAFGTAGLNPAITAGFTIHPVQGYFAITLLLLGIGGWLFGKKADPRRLSAIVVGLLALIWLVLGFFRGDDPAIVLGLKAPQLQAIGGLAWAVLIWRTQPKGEDTK